MACFRNGGYSYFGPYYPCNVWTSTTECDSNTVINPIILPSYALFALATPTVVAGGGTVLLTPVTLSGTGIVSPVAGEITLLPGTYFVSYSIGSLFGASGTNAFGLSQNGVQIPSTVASATGTPGSATTLGNQTLITVTTPSVVRLVNYGADAVTVNSANLVIQRIS